MRTPMSTTTLDLAGTGPLGRALYQFLATTAAITVTLFRSTTGCRC